MQTYFLRYFISLLLLLALPTDAASQETLPVRLSGHVPTQTLSNATLLNHLDPATQLPVTFVLPLRNQAELEELVQRIYDPTDESHYGKYLTPEEFAEQFAPTEEDYQTIIAYAKSLGLTIANTHPNRTLLNVSGPSGSLEAAFNLQLHQYQKPNGQTFYAPDNDPAVPASIASVIHSIVGLDNQAVRHTYHRRKGEFLPSSITPNTHPSGPGGGYAPSDLLTAYNLTGVSANGSNQIIALFELAGYQASDITAYTNYFGLPSAQLTNILVDGGSGGATDAEVALDIELALALAPASKIYVYEGPNSDQGVLDTYNRIATDNAAKQVSTSWGLGENFSSSSYLQAENAIFLQMAAHGQSIYAAAGDRGAYDDYPYNMSLVVDDPASQPYVVGVGGTRLTVNAGSGAYTSESVWNDGLGNGAGGGGISSVWPIPTWQQSVSTTVSKTHRNVPDVSLNADEYTGYSIYYSGGWQIYGGTSCAAPLWAAFTARVNQGRVAASKSVLGFANPSLYSIGTGSSYAANFHDILTGNNLYYSAAVGYDNASGWGSFNGANLFASLIGSGPSLLPVWNINMTSSGLFKKGGTGTYTIVASNRGNGPTAGTVSVVITLPTGLTANSLGGTGWTINNTTHTCTRSNALQAGSSYPPITLVVNVARTAPNTFTSSATVSGGGAASSATATYTTTSR
jgi:kumamolisin